jgi:hypothetical protein
MAFSEYALKRFGDNIAFLMKGKIISRETAKDDVRDLKGEGGPQQGAFWLHYG